MAEELRADLVLNVDDALSSIDRIGAGLNQTAQQFAVALSDALGVLDQPIAVDVTADTGGVADALTAVEAEAADALIVVPVEGDTEQLASDLDALDAPQLVADVLADTTQAESELNALEAPTDVVIQVEANTTQAEASLAGVGDAAASSTGGVGELNRGVEGLSASLTLVEGSGQGVLDFIGQLGPAGEAAAVGIGVLAGVTGVLFAQAIEAQGVTDAFNRTLGSLGTEVRTVDVAGLNTDLADLAIALGSDDEAALNAAQKFAQLGQAAGASGDQIDTTTGQIAALAANARATNPALGDLASIQDGLSRALARGGRFVGQYGISLTGAEIEARALADTGKTTAAELTQFEKVAAGAAIATDRLGSSIEGNVSGALDDSAVSFARLQEEFKNTIEQLGQPFIVPVLDLLESAAPLALAFVGALADVSEALLPLAQAAIEAAGPFVQLFSDQITAAAQAFAPLLDRVAVVLGDVFASLEGDNQAVLAAFSDLLSESARISVALFDALEPLIRVLLPLFADTLNGNAGAIQAFADLMGIAAAAVEGVGDALSPAGALFGFFSDQTDEQAAAAERAAEANNVLRESLFGQATTFQTVGAAVAKLDSGFADFVATQSLFADDVSVERALQRTGIEAEALLDQFGSLDAGFKSFVEQAVRTGEITLKIDGVDATADDVAGLDGNLTDLINTGRVAITNGEDLAFTFNQQQVALEEAARVQFDAVAASRGLNDEQQKQIAAYAAATFGIDSYQNRLRALSDFQSAEAAAAAEAVVLPLELQAEAWLALGDAVAQGTVNQQNFAGFAEGLAAQLGVSSEQIGQFVTFIETEVARLTEAFQANVPTINELFASITDVTDPQQFIDNLNLRTLGLILYRENLQKISEGSRADVIAVLSQLPLEQAQAIAASLAQSTPELQAAFGQAGVAGEGAINDLNTFLAGEARTETSSSLEALAQFGTSAFGVNLNFEQAGRDGITQFSAFVKTDGTTDVGLASSNAGKVGGDNLTSGYAVGIAEGTGDVTEAARQMIRDVEAAARDEADSDSPSKLFAKIGRDLTAGMSVGLSDGTRDVVAAAEAIVQEAALAAASTPLAFDVSGGDVTGGTGGVVINQLRVEVSAAPGMTAADAKAIGAAAVEGAVDAASRAQVRAAARAS